jgi:hypothetical protein
MDTPSLQKLLARHGLEVPGLYDPASVAAAVLARLPHGPLQMFPFGPDDTQAIEQARRARIAKVTEIAQSFFGPGAGHVGEPAARPAPAAPLCADDERAIAAVLLRYATAIDTRDWALFGSCFTAACATDYGAFGQWTSVGALTAEMERMHAAMGATLHRITNIVLAPAPAEAGERRVHARSYVDAILTGKDAAQPPRQGIGYYEDVLADTAQGWKIAVRRFVAVHIQ